MRYNPTMFRLAASTVACPDWPLDVVLPNLAHWGFEGVELRTFGAGDSRLACEPALSDPAKVRGLCRAHGVEAASVATSGRYDAKIRPPIIGQLIGDPEACVRASKRDIDLAVSLSAPIVRVFAHELPRRQRRGAALKRITDRLRFVCDHARNNGVRVAVQNGGSFASAIELAELIDRVKSPLLGASYDASTGIEAGDSPIDAITTLGPRLLQARLRDFKDHTPVAPGLGDSQCRRFVEALVETDFNGWLVYEWPKLFLPEIEDATAALPGAAGAVYGWLAGAGAPAEPEAVPA
jgi:sugar phosphate isomerase/epimerase